MTPILTTPAELAERLGRSGGPRVLGFDGRARTLGQTKIIANFFGGDVASRDGIRQVVTEDARFLAFSGAPTDAEWLAPEEVDRLLLLEADANLAGDQAALLLERVVADAPALTPALDAEADRLADELLDAHRRVRTDAGVQRRGLAVTAQKPVDVLGLYVWLPVASA